MIKLTINTMDIIAGKRANAQECPVACAMKRLTGNRWVVSVRSHGSITLMERKTGKRVGQYQIPKSLLNFIAAFDGGHIDHSYPITEYTLRGSLPEA